VRELVHGASSSEYLMVVLWTLFLKIHINIFAYKFERCKSSWEIQVVRTLKRELSLKNENYSIEVARIQF